MLTKKIVLGVGVTDATREEILEYIANSLEKNEKPYYIATPNPEILVYAHKHEHFREVLNNAKIALTDGVGLLWAARILGKPLKERFTGVDFIEMVCKRSAIKPITMGFLGGRQNVALKTAECLMEKYPSLKVVFVAEEWGEEGFVNAGSSKLQFKVQNYDKYSKIQNTPIDILFVAFGFPKQEEWMATHNGKLPVKVMVGVGGAFDYLSGTVRRAPSVVRSIGLEWLFRLIRQPWRVRRQLALFNFIILVLKERFRL